MTELIINLLYIVSEFAAPFCYLDEKSCKKRGTKKLYKAAHICGVVFWCVFFIFCVGIVIAAYCVGK